MGRKPAGLNRVGRKREKTARFPRLSTRAGTVSEAGRYILFLFAPFVLRKGFCS
jgi:hypothetical protein